MNIALFDELENKIRLLADELKSAKQGISSGGSPSGVSEKLAAIEMRVEHLIQLLDEYSQENNG